MVELGVTAFHRRSFITTRRALAGVEQLGFDLVPPGLRRAGLVTAEGDDLLAAWEEERAAAPAG